MKVEDRDLENRVELQNEADKINVPLIRVKYIGFGNSSNSFSSSKFVYGFYVPKYDSITGERGWVKGTVYFYPDSNGDCYGYVYDIEKNREILARVYMEGFIKIVNDKIDNEVKALCKKNGWDIIKKTESNISNEERIRKELEEKIRKELEEKIRKEMEVKNIIGEDNKGEVRRQK